MRLLFTLVLPAILFAAEPWDTTQTVEPATLAARLRDAQAAPPKIFYVGPAVLYRSKHIPGAVFAGPAARPQGLAALRDALAKLPKDREVIVYCGCCPLKDCPNLRPAFRLLREMGFQNGKVLMTPVSFLKDWIDKGYPVESGEPADTP